MTAAAPSLSALADLARAEAERHPPGSRQRAAASEVWTALATSGDLDAARRVIWRCPDPAVRSNAFRLLDRLAGQADATTGTTDRSST